MEKDSYPSLKWVVSDEASMPALTPEMLDSALARWTDPERIRQREEARFAQEDLLRNRIKAEYARRLGVETLTPEQVKDLWDGLTDAWWRHMKRTTNIEEWLAE